MDDILEIWFRVAGDLQAIRYHAKRLKKHDIVELIDEFEQEMQELETPKCSIL